MLTALRIQNFAIIDELEVRFGPGFNVLTGETGAGKSILVDALHIVLGGRATADVIRTGAEEAVVEALFEGDALVEKLRALELPGAEEGELLIRRVLSRQGRGRVWINGAVATVSLLERVAKGLVDISGQHEHVSLLDPQIHLELLDGYAGHPPMLAEYRARYDRYRELARERDGIVTDDTERSRRAEYLSFQLDEIEKLDLKPGEEESLAQERKRLGSAEKLRAAAEEGEQRLYSGEQSARDLIAAALQRLVDAAAIDPELAPVVASLKTAQVEVEESSRVLTDYARDIELDSGRLGEIDDRLEAIKRLVRKHGGDVAALLKRRDEMRQELDGISHHGERLEELAKACAEAEKGALETAKRLTEARREAAQTFEKAVVVELSRLAMEKTVFRVGLKSLAELGPAGLDGCELLLSPNPGEEPKPLGKIASGGELSRVMLAIKRTLAKLDPVLTYVFDEVDTGIGGAVAGVVGQLLHEVSGERQVLCITHLPQIAAFGSRHFRVEKQVHAGRTSTRIVPLEAKDRTSEVARMLAGVEVTPAALKNAEEMIVAATKPARRAS